MGWGGGGSALHPQPSSPPTEGPGGAVVKYNGREQDGMGDIRVIKR